MNKQKTTIYLDEDLLIQLKKLAKEEDRPLSYLVNRAVRVDLSTRVKPL